MSKDLPYKEAALVAALSDLTHTVITQGHMNPMLMKAFYKATETLQAFEDQFGFNTTIQ